MLEYENKFLSKGYKFVIGIDEAGRGPLAGPVVAACVCLAGKTGFSSKVDDSKKMTPGMRQKAFLEITGTCHYGVGVVNESVIDSINILNSTRLAMQIALANLLDSRKTVVSKRQACAIIDGRMQLPLDLPSEEIIGGDAKSLSIAAASVVAKVIRDRIMCIYDRAFPNYGFREHKGYGTSRHITALMDNGLSPIHRKSFCLRFR